MGTLLGLALRMEKAASDIESKASDIAVNVALSVVGDLSYSTPVDTSYAISNWQTTIGNKANSEVSHHFLGSKGSTQQASAYETFNQAYAILSTKKPGEPIYISNLSGYITDLNNGSSLQHSGGFVESAVTLGQTLAKRSKLGI